MARTVAIGVQGFAKLRECGAFYVDKTGFIREWWNNHDDVTLISRPRRFGKTLTLDMVRCFFSTEYANRSDLFEGLDIWNDERFRAMQGTRPVISVSLGNVKENTFRGMVAKISILLDNLFTEHVRLMDWEGFRSKERQAFDSISDAMPKERAQQAIQLLSRLLFRRHGKKPIILLDEYDTPMQAAWVHGYRDEASDFMRGLFEATFKSNEYLERALITGITRVARESLFSGLNNIESVTTTSEKYETCFGFTEAEVFAAMDEFGLTDKDGVKAWYDGFTFGRRTDIYNPWSITNYLKTNEFKAWWASSSSNDLVEKLVREGDETIKIGVEELMADRGTLSTFIDEQIEFRQLEDSAEAVWSLFLATGYLRVLEYEPTTGQSTLALTNAEVRRMFDGFVRRWFARGNSTGRAYRAFLTALSDGDVPSLNRFLTKILVDMCSFFDTGGSEPERFYHGLVLGMLVSLRDRYRVTSNRESGYGRYDVMLTPLNRGADPGIVIEFKAHDGFDSADLSATAASALKQIDDKQYAAALAAGGIPADRIIKYGIAFSGKECLAVRA